MPKFHHAVKSWFSKKLGTPTSIQKEAWPLIRSKQHVLISAPTGSGKTLAAFLAIIDSLVWDAGRGDLKEETSVLYVSPLKALSNDIHRNLQEPLKGINEQLVTGGLEEAGIRVALRTGDTTTSQRSAMYRKPPHILVTTPESLYLLLTSGNGRRMLSTVSTVIIDEIHAILESKRGSHLALSMARLEALTEKSLTRIGLSATQKPIALVAEFLCGKKACRIINAGHRREMDIAITVTNSPLEAVMSNEVWTEIYHQLQSFILSHQTTLIFVNTRRLAERMAHHLSKELGTELVTAHHGSMSKEQRLEAELKLKSGQLRALVATASMELGIDIGSVDLVCQIGSPNSISNFLQRVGRSGHTVYGTPKGRLFPLSRDELVESAALMRAIQLGALDTLEIPENPLDVLAQQIVAEVANKDYQLEELWQLVRSAYPYRNISLEELEEIVDMLAQGFALRQGRRGAYIFYDVVNGKITPRRNARLTALMSGGAIPDNFDVDVIMEPSGTFVGTLNEDFALESLPGNVFQLGNNSYRVLRLETGKMRVEDAQGQPPNIPFWLGEAPGRSWELSQAVSAFRMDLCSKFPPTETWENHEDWNKKALQWLTDEIQIPEEAAVQIIDYLAAGQAALGVIPSHQDIVLERFFDEAGDQHLVVHAPFGSRINQAWGLALRKKFCRRFNFELQAAANEDAIILSLGATHSFELMDVYKYLNPKTLRQVLVQALLDAPMFEIRWRWNASIALAVLRRRSGKRVPPQIQRMQSEDLVALIFPDQLACLENISGEREVPDHPLVRQTLQDCLYEAMDFDRLKELIEKIRNGDLGLHGVDLREASPMAHEIISSKPYTFIDDTPFEERRTLAINQRRWIDPAEAKELGKLDPAAIDLVKKQAWIEAETPDELHDGLVLAGFVTESEISEERAQWNPLFQQLMDSGRASKLPVKGKNYWVAVEKLNCFKSLFPKEFPVGIKIPDKFMPIPDPEKALLELIRGRMETIGAVTTSQLADSLSLPESGLKIPLSTLEQEGFIFRGHFSDAPDKEWCERRLLARIHRYTLKKLRQEIAPVSAGDFMRFLFDWQHITENKRLEGPQAVEAVLEQLEGFELPAACWERDIFPSRICDYDYLWIDVQCLSGNYLWGRFNPTGQSKAPVKTTPITFISRSRMTLWHQFRKTENPPEMDHPAREIWEYLIKHGATFYQQIVGDLGMLKVNVEEGLSELVAHGLITSDSFTGLRALLVPGKFRISHSKRRRKPTFNLEEAGRWSIIPLATGEQKIPLETLQETAWLLLRRYGVVFRKLVDREKALPPWRDLVRTFRILEARGEIRGGRFVGGVWGEQFALKEAVTLLRATVKKVKDGNLVTVSATDPLNLTGIITPGGRVPALINNRILYLDGEPVGVKNGKEVNFIQTPEKSDHWKWHQALTRREVAPRLRSYLGR